MKKILTVIGARPQFVKAAAVSRALKGSGIEEIIVHTGQHFDANMSTIFFEQMEIPVPVYNLDINSVSHGAMTGRMLEELEKVMQKELPDAVMIYGDTNSTIAGALAAKKLHIKVIHVEAGLRSFNMAMPEEVNRILTDRISDILFCPTEQAVSNLKSEGFENFDATVIKNGDVMQDAAIYYSAFSSGRTTIADDLSLTGRPFVLATLHRQENVDVPENLQNIFTALNEIAEDIRIILPLHPRTRKIIENSPVETGEGIEFIDPVGYLEMIELLKNCSMVMTDSGGLQKEAYFFGKPCITLREETEWVELVEHGVNVLTGSDPKKIKESFVQMKEGEFDFNVDLYGNGKASAVIVENLIKLL